MAREPEAGALDCFVYESQAARVVFGVGSLDRLGEEIDRLGLKRVLLLATGPQRGQAEELAGRLGGGVAGIHDQAVMHVPVETARAASAQAGRLGAHRTVAIGGRPPPRPPKAAAPPPRPPSL